MSRLAFLVLCCAISAAPALAPTSGRDGRAACRLHGRRPKAMRQRAAWRRPNPRVLEGAQGCAVGSVQAGRAEGGEHEQRWRARAGRRTASATNGLAAASNSGATSNSGAASSVSGAAPTGHAGPARRSSAFVIPLPNTERPPPVLLQALTCF